MACLPFEINWNTWAHCLHAFRSCAHDLGKILCKSWANRWAQQPSPYSSCIAVQLACLPRYILRELFLCFSFYGFSCQVEWHQHQLAYRWMTWSAECGRVECLQPILLPVFRGAPLWLSHDKGFGPFKLLTLCVLQKRWDNSPLKACFEKSTSIFSSCTVLISITQYGVGLNRWG